jgi:hypothetical protein
MNAAAPQFPVVRASSLLPLSDRRCLDRSRAPVGVRFAARLLLPSLVILLFVPEPARAQSTLKVINPPGGGRVIYGQIPGEATESAAMGWILRSLHQEFDDRPQVGKLFQIHGTQSIAAFFSLNNHFQGNAPLNGLMIVTKTATDHVEGAVVYDQAAKFSPNCAPLMATLFHEWHPFAVSAPVNSSVAGPAAPVPPLHPFVTPDRSISVDLPDGWKTDPTSNGGTLFASGPNGEVVMLGLTVLANDTRNPSVQQTIRTLQQGGLRGTAYANAFYYSAGEDLTKMFVDSMQFVRHRSQLPQAVFEVANATPVAVGAGQRSAHLSGHLDPQDGTGQREFNAIFSVGAPGRFGGYLITDYFTSVPVAVADQQRATLGAILASFQEDLAIVQGEARALAAPVIAGIHEIGLRAAKQAQSAHETAAIHNSSVYQHWDDLDRRSQEFANSQLGYSVVNDQQNHAHGTLWSEDADLLVKHDPQRFEYVNAPNFWQGIDY